MSISKRIPTASQSAFVLSLLTAHSAPLTSHLSPLTSHLFQHFSISAFTMNSFIHSGILDFTETDKVKYKNA